MANIQVHFAGVEDAATHLRAAGDAMAATMEQAGSVILSSSQELSGSLQSAATDLYLSIKGSDTQMQGDIQAAASVLVEMANLLQEADTKGASYMQL